MDFPAEQAGELAFSTPVRASAFSSPEPFGLRKREGSGVKSEPLRLSRRSYIRHITVACQIALQFILVGHELCSIQKPLYSGPEDLRT